MNVPIARWTEVEGVDADLLVAYPHAAPAQDAAVVVDEDDLVEDFLGVRLRDGFVGALVDFLGESLVLQLAGAGLVAVGAIQGMVLQLQLNHVAADFLDRLAIRDHAHAGRGLHGAGGHGPRRPRLNLHHAHAAGAVGIQAGIGAERWDFDADGLTGLQYRGARGHLHLDAVDRQADEFVAHRSTSPKTMSMLPMRATVSAIIPPTAASSMTPRLTNDGERTWQR